MGWSCYVGNKTHAGKVARLIELGVAKPAKHANNA